MNEGIEIAGLRFWGSPATPLYGGAFGLSSAADRTRLYWQIPDDTDVLITHVPPMGSSIPIQIPICIRGAVNSLTLWSAWGLPYKSSDMFTGHMASFTLTERLSSMPRCLAQMALCIRIPSSCK